MSHVSSISNSSYPYRGTLSRLDANDDGVLSREERAAADRPGILEIDSDDEGNGDSANGTLGSLMEKLMQMPASGAAANGNFPQANTAFDIDLLTPMDAYNSTYGQYDVDSVAA